MTVTVVDTLVCNSAEPDKYGRVDAPAHFLLEQLTAATMTALCELQNLMVFGAHRALFLVWLHYCLF